MKNSRYTGQDAQMRSPAAAEDLKCHCNGLAVLPALQHLFKSAVLRSDFKTILVQSWRFNFLPLREKEGEEACDPFIKGVTHR